MTPTCSPAGAVRERPVVCRCGRATWNFEATCDACLPRTCIECNHRQATRANPVCSECAERTWPGLCSLADLAQATEDKK